MEHCKSQKLRRKKVLTVETKDADSAEEENCMEREYNVKGGENTGGNERRKIHEENKSLSAKNRRRKWC